MAGWLLLSDQLLTVIIGINIAVVVVRNERGKSFIDNYIIIALVSPTILSLPFFWFRLKQRDYGRPGL